MKHSSGALLNFITIMLLEMNIGILMSLILLVSIINDGAAEQAGAF